MYIKLVTVCRKPLHLEALFFKKNHSLRMGNNQGYQKEKMTPSSSTTEERKKNKERVAKLNDGNLPVLIYKLVPFWLFLPSLIHLAVS